MISHSQVSAADCLHWAPITDLQWLPGFKVPRIAVAGVTDRPPTVRPCTLSAVLSVHVRLQALQVYKLLRIVLAVPSRRLQVYQTLGQKQ